MNKQRKLQYVMIAVFMLVSFCCIALSNISLQVDPGFSVKSHQDGWRITHSDYADLKEDTYIQAIQIDNQVHAIDALWLKQAIPDIGSDEKMAQFLAGEQLLYDAIEKHVSLIDDKGNLYPISFHKRTLMDMGLYFWLFPFLALLSMAMALTAIWLDTLNRYHAINLAASIAFSMSMMSAISAFDRMWAVNPDLLICHFYVGNLSMRVFTVLYLYLLWQLPHPLGMGKWYRHIPLYVGGLLLATWALQVSGIYTNYGLLVVRVMFISGLMIVLALYLQWRAVKQNNRQKLLNKIALRWMVATIIICGVFGFGYNLLWLFGIADGSESDAINASITLVFTLGIVTLLLKSKMYRLDSWWWRARGIFGGMTIGLFVLIISAEMLLGYTFSAVLAAVSAAAVMYFVFTTYFRYRYAKHDSHIMERAVPRLINVTMRLNDLEKSHLKWCEVLNEVFNPLYCQTQSVSGISEKNPSDLTGQQISASSEKLSDAVSVSATKSKAIGDLDKSFSETDARQLFLKHKLTDEHPALILREGEEMLVLGLSGEYVLLTGAAQGMRLFTQTDIRRVTLFWRIVSEGQRVQAAYLEGESNERRRIAADLHDDIGGKLLYLASASGKYGNYAQDTLQDLRTLTQGLSGDNKTLAELAADLNYQLAERCDAMDVDFKSDWTLSDAEHIQVSAQAATLLTSILSELLRNALQHEQVGTVRLNMVVENDQLSVSLCNDGQHTNPSQWKSGLGTASVRRRVNEVKGEVSWKANQSGGVLCELRWNVWHWSVL